MSGALAQLATQGGMHPEWQGLLEGTNSPDDVEWMREEDLPTAIANKVKFLDDHFNEENGTFPSRHNLRHEASRQATATVNPLDRNGPLQLT